MSITKQLPDKTSRILTSRAAERLHHSISILGVSRRIMPVTLRLSDDSGLILVFSTAERPLPSQIDLEDISKADIDPPAAAE